MSASVQLGLVLALLTAFGSVAGFLYKFRGAREAPEVELRRPLHSTVELFRSPLYALGIADRAGLLGAARRRAGAGADLARAVGDRRRAGAADGGRRPAVRDRGHAARVDRRRADRGRAGVPGGDARRRCQQRPLALRPGDARGIFVWRVRRRSLGLPARALPARGGADRAGRLGRAAVGGVGHLDQGAQLAPQRARVRRADPSAGARDPGRVAGRTADLGPQPAARRRRADDRPDQRRREPDDDRRRADRVRRAAAERAARARGQDVRVRAGDRRRGADAAAGGGRAPPRAAVPGRGTRAPRRRVRRAGRCRGRMRPHALMEPSDCSGARARDRRCIPGHETT